MVVSLPWLGEGVGTVCLHVTLCETLLIAQGGANASAAHVPRISCNVCGPSMATRVLAVISSVSAVWL